MNRRGSGSVDRKTLQLCAQVADTLNAVLSGECDDDDLRELMVVGVVPAPHAGQLLVSVAQALPGEPLDVGLAARKLAAAGARLRQAVAEAITRRRAPALLFTVAADYWAEGARMED